VSTSLQAAVDADRHRHKVFLSNTACYACVVHEDVRASIIRPDKVTPFLAVNAQIISSIAGEDLWAKERGAGASHIGSWLP
jgi:hypothetical protein